VGESESRHQRGGPTASRGSASPQGSRWATTSARGTDWRTNPGRWRSRGTDARGTDARDTDSRGTKARAHITPRAGPVGGRSCDRDRPGAAPEYAPGRRLGSSTARAGRAGGDAYSEDSEPGRHDGAESAARVGRELTAVAHRWPVRNVLATGARGVGGVSRLDSNYIYTRLDSNYIYSNCEATRIGDWGSRRRRSQA